MGLKIYEHLIATYLSTDVTLNGKKVPVVFNGGTHNNPTKVTAKYSTRNEEIQKQIEGREDFGKTIKIFLEEKVEEPVKPDSKPETVVIPDGFTAVPGITTAIEAKDYLLEKFAGEVKHADLKNTAMVKEFAASKQLIFTELN